MALAIRAARLFDGASSHDNPLLLVDGGRIVDVHYTGAPVPEGYQLVDLGEAMLLPGLVDAHIHLVFNASTDPVGHLADVDDDVLLAEARVAARRALAAGVTCVRDLGDRSYLGVRLREEFAADPAAGPDVVPAGPPITVLNGHCWFLGGAVSGMDGVREAVRERTTRGASVIKVMVTGGRMTAGTAMDECQFTAAELRAAVDEAHRQGLPITGHAHGRDGIAAAVRAGFDGVEHASFFTGTQVQPDPAVIAALATSGTVVSGGLPGGVPGVPVPPVMAALRPQGVGLLRLMLAAGVRFVVGPDGGIAPHRPHDVLPYAIADLSAVMSTAQALSAATHGAAAACGLGERKGRLARGYDADILAVAGDPLADITALRRPVAVFHRGARVATGPNQPSTRAPA